MNDLVGRDAESFFHQKGSSPVAAALRRAGGIWLETIDGRRLIDLHGNTAHHLGHAHPRLIEALKQQLDTLPFSPRRFTNEPAVLLAERLRRLWPGAPGRVLFAAGGTNAIEIAVRLCRVASGRFDVIAFEGSYHGHSMGAHALASARLDPRLGPPLPGILHVTPYWREAERSLGEIEAALAQSAGGVACLVAEPMRSNCMVPPPGYWPEVRNLCDRHGARLVFDEIPSGLGKTGRFFAFEQVGTVPDAVVLGKALGGGILPIAAVIADERMNVAPELDLGHFTHEKNPLTCRAALTTLDIIEEDGLVARAADNGAYALQRMAELAGRDPFFAGGRGLGLLLALELSNKDTATVARLLPFLVAEGVSTVAKSPGAIGFSPPICITREEIDDTLARIERASRHFRNAGG